MCSALRKQGQGKRRLLVYHYSRELKKLKRVEQSLSLLVHLSSHLPGNLHSSDTLSSRNLHINQLYIACVIGGVGARNPVKKLHSGVDVLVAAPGRLMDFKNQGHVDLKKTEFLVLDECDRLLDMGFIPDAADIIDDAKNAPVTTLFCHHA